MDRVGIGMEEPDGDALDPGCGERRHQRVDGLFVEGFQYAAARVDALRHGEAQPARHDRLHLLDHQVVLVVAGLVADLENVAEPFGGDEGGPGAAPLEHGVGGERRAVEDEPDIVRRQPGFLQRFLQAVDHTLLGGLRRGQHLGRGPHPAGFQHDIREGAAHIDPDPATGLRLTHNDRLSLNSDPVPPGPHDAGPRIAQAAPLQTAAVQWSLSSEPQPYMRSSNPFAR